MRYVYMLLYMHVSRPDSRPTEAKYEATQTTRPTPRVTLSSKVLLYVIATYSLVSDVIRAPQAGRRRVPYSRPVRLHPPDSRSTIHFHSSSHGGMETETSSHSSPRAPKAKL